MDKGRQQFHPDQGWSWVVLVAAFLSVVIFDGMIFSFGVYLPDLANYFDEGLGATAWIGSTIASVYALAGPLAHILSNKFGCRLVSIAGSIVACIGLFISVYSPAVWCMVLTYGIIAGVGSAMMFHCPYVMVGYYFQRWRALATGTTACGSGVGIFIFSQLGSVLLNTYGWKGSVWILAGIMLNGTVLGCFFRPAPIMPSTDNDGITKKKKLISFKLLKSPSFMIFALSSFLCAMGLFVPFIYLPSFAIQMGSNHYKASVLLSICAGANTVGRILCGWVSDKSWSDPLMIYSVALIIGGLATVCCAWLSIYALQAVYAVVFGLFFACYVCLSPIILIELFGLENLSDAFGFLNFFRGISSFVGAPLAGIMHDATGNFDLPFYLAGIIIAIGGIICLPLRKLSHFILSRNRSPEMRNQKEIAIEKMEGDNESIHLDGNNSESDTSD